ncbi:MAG: hypothetical protein AB2989_06540 [Candidatus Symbiodolus clandestinus]
MNPFNLRLQRLTLPAPLPVHLTAETLTAWKTSDDLTTWIRRRAVQRLLRVRQWRLAVRQAARQYVQRMRKRGQAQVTQLFEQTRQQAIVETIQWLVTSQQIEQALTDHLVQQAAQWAVAAFKQLVADADQPQLLWQQLQGSLHELQGHGQLTLRVHPSQSQALQNRLDNLHVIADQQLQPLQAFLESPLVKVELDLQHHLNLLIEQLLTSTFSPPEEDSALCAEGILQGTALAVSSEGASIESATIGQEETDE